jgi:hypothetical protein
LYAVVGLTGRKEELLPWLSALSHSPSSATTVAVLPLFLDDSGSGGYYRFSIQPVVLPEVPRTCPVPAALASTGAASVKSHHW